MITFSYVFYESIFWICFSDFQWRLFTSLLKDHHNLRWIRPGAQNKHFPRSGTQMKKKNSSFSAICCTQFLLSCKNGIFVYIFGCIKMTHRLLINSPRLNIEIALYNQRPLTIWVLYTVIISNYGANTVEKSQTSRIMFMRRPTQLRNEIPPTLRRRHKVSQYVPLAKPKNFISYL